MKITSNKQCTYIVNITGNDVDGCKGVVLSVFFFVNYFPTFPLPYFQHSLENFKNHIHLWLPLTMLLLASWRAISSPLTFAHFLLAIITLVPDFYMEFNMALETMENLVKPV